MLALHNVPGLGPIRLKALLDHFQDPKQIWQLDENDLASIGVPESVRKAIKEAQKNFEPEKFQETLKQLKIQFITIFDDSYPTLLKQIHNPPIVLYYKGQLPNPNLSCIGVVGTRKMTGYGKLVTEKFSAYLSQNGLVIVSGLAKGVDGIAHKAVVETKGQTIAVLGGGLKNIFPPEHQALATSIIEGGFGAVVSEYPPEQPSLPGNFPARNRIIAGLSKGVVVTEASEDSGSLITAQMALEQNREVYAIPGPITSEYSKGPSALIKQGAKLVTDPQEILDDLGISSYPVIKLDRESQIVLSASEQAILDQLLGENKHIDELCRILDTSTSAVAACLIKLEIRGLVKNIGGGTYCKTI